MVDHFVREGIARRTVYNALNRRKNGQSILEVTRSGRPSSWTSSMKVKLKRLVNHRKGVSQRKLGNKFNKHHMTIGRQIKKLGIEDYAREKTPKYTEEQAVKAKKRSRKLVNLLYQSKAEIIMDDEKYFCLNGDNMPGSARYYTDDKSKCSDDVRFIGKNKYPQKILMWLAISNRGMSIPYFRPSKSVAINTEIYINECLQPRLLPFIHKHHGDFNYLFWPDLARAHYSKESVAWMNENVYFVDETTNPPNVPQARPIENLWGILAQKVYEGGWEAKTQQELISRIQSQLKKFDSNFLQSLMGGVKTKLRAIADRGVLASNKNDFYCTDIYFVK